MNKLEILSLILIALSALSLYKYGTVDPQHSTLGVFETWMNNFKKFYMTEEEKAYRFGVWMKNFEFVQEHNTRFYKGLETYDLEMNAFADLTSEEFGEIYLMDDFELKNTNKCTGAAPPTTSKT